MKVLVTGGAGYIGSHTCVALIAAGHTPIVVDNLLNSKAEALNRIEKITGQKITFYQKDIRDKSSLEEIFEQEKPDAVIHFAGLKAVGESVANPWMYYDNNVSSTLVLIEVMRAANCFNLVFSSSATVYGLPDHCPLSESAPLSAINPYGRTKLMIEEMLRDLCVAEKSWNISLLRYFNPVGAHASGLIGEDPNGIPNNLMPYITQVAVGRLQQLRVFGGDYPTKDGTGVRDYIHVVDLAEGHVAALEWLLAGSAAGATAINLGTGSGYSVLDVIKAFEQASGKKIAYEIVERRAGDAASCYADASLAKQLLNWQAKKTLAEMCQDAWRWQSQNPNGYV